MCLIKLLCFCCEILCWFSQDFFDGLVQLFWCDAEATRVPGNGDRKSTRLNSSHVSISYAVFCLKKKIRVNHTVFVSRPSVFSLYPSPSRFFLSFPTRRSSDLFSCSAARSSSCA